MFRSHSLRGQIHTLWRWNSETIPSLWFTWKYHNKGSKNPFKLDLLSCNDYGPGGLTRCHVVTMTKGGLTAVMSWQQPRGSSRGINSKKLCPTKKLCPLFRRPFINISWHRACLYIKLMVWPGWHTAWSTGDILLCFVLGKEIFNCSLSVSVTHVPHAHIRQFLPQSYIL